MTGTMSVDALALALAVASTLGIITLVVRRLWLARRDRAHQQRERVLRDVALDLIDGELETLSAPLDERDAEVLAAIFARYAARVTGVSRARITTFFERRGDVQRTMAALERRRAWRRAAAAHALGDMGSLQAIGALLQALGDRSREVRTAAARSLGVLGAEQAVGPLTRALAQREVPRLVAGNALLSIGSIAVMPLRTLVADGDAGVRATAVELLGLLGEARDVPVLLGLLRYDVVPVRTNAADALGRLGARRAAEALRDALGDPAASVREAAARALGQLNDREALAALLGQARHDTFSAAQAAARAAALIDPASVEHARHLDAGPHLREIAQRQLAQV